MQSHTPVTRPPGQFWATQLQGPRHTGGGEPGAPFGPGGQTRGETRALIGGGEYSYIRVLHDEFLLKLTLMTADFKRNSSGRTRRYEYSPPN